MNECECVLLLLFVSGSGSEPLCIKLIQEAFKSPHVKALFWKVRLVVLGWGLGDRKVLGGPSDTARGENSISFIHVGP